MSDARFKIRVADDKKTVAIQTAPGDQMPYQVELTLAELDKLMGELGDARSELIKDQPSPNFAEARISAVANTTWSIKASPPRGALFAFDHPKFGPVGFTLSRDQIVSIVKFLTERFILQSSTSVEKH